LAHMGLEKVPSKMTQSTKIPEKKSEQESKYKMKPMEPFSGQMTPAFNEYYDLGMKGGRL
jgi:hypothetical protein